MSVASGAARQNEGLAVRHATESDPDAYGAGTGTRWYELAISEDPTNSNPTDVTR